MASPIFNQRGEVIAALSISGPSARLSLEKINELKPIILEISRNLSKQLGYE